MAGIWPGGCVPVPGFTAPGVHDEAHGVENVPVFEVEAVAEFIDLAAFKSLARDRSELRRNAVVGDLAVGLRLWHRFCGVGQSAAGLCLARRLWRHRLRAGSRGIQTAAATRSQSKKTGY